MADTQKTAPDAPSKPAASKAKAEKHVKMIKVETTGQFMIQDPFTLDEVSFTDEGGKEIRDTPYIQSQIAQKQLREV